MQLFKAKHIYIYTQLSPHTYIYCKYIRKAFYVGGPGGYRFECQNTITKKNTHTNKTTDTKSAMKERKKDNKTIVTSACT